MRDYPEILEHYSDADEEQRLASGPGRLELVRTQPILESLLPAAPATIYDVGGGPGIYSLWLASRGYDVHLIDVVPKHIEQARAAAAAEGIEVASMRVGDARMLDVEDGVADAVLLLGPLYHLPEAEDRKACWQEVARILRPGGVAVGAVISRFASLLDGLRRDLIADPVFVELVEEDLRSGVHTNETENPEYFTTAYLHRMEEARSEAEVAGLEVIDLLGVEGPAWLFPDLQARLDDPAKRERLLRFLGLVEREPSLLGVSAHVLVCVRLGADG